MTTSPLVGLPWIASQQDQPEVSHNEALLLLQALLFGVLGSQNAPPGGPAAGQAYIVGSAGSGAWNGHSNQIAIYSGTAWAFLPGYTTAGAIIPMGATHEGMRVWRRDLDCAVVWTGTAWVDEGGAMQSSTVAGAGAATGPKRWKYISDEAGGAVPAFNDGSDWRRCTDRAVIS